jgi:hypothetical protein
VTYPELSEKELAAIAPVKDGKPDLYNHLPTRFIPLDEAKHRQWKWFFVGDICSHGHKACRYVSNPRFCVDCRRIKDGLQPVGGKGVAEYTNRPRAYSEPAPRSSEGAQALPARPLEPDVSEKKFLVAYAKTKDFTLAAKEVNTDDAVFRARLSYSKVFKDAVNALEEQLGMTHTAKLDENFDWTEDKRSVLVRVYIDTGDLGLARDAIQVSNYHFQRELQDNGEFASMLADAEPLANRILDEHAIRKAKNGDSRLLDRVLTAKLPEYSPKMRVDMNVSEKLTDDQLNARFGQVLKQLVVLNGEKRLLPGVIDAEFYESGSQDEAPDVGDSSRESAASLATQNSDLL